MRHETRHEGEDGSDRPPPGMPGGDMNQRGGRVDIGATTSKFEEAAEESFPASDPPSHTPAGYVDCPPPHRK